MTGRPRTAAQVQASQRNGARSRGPTSAAGKARSARNALQHGLTAREVVLLDDEEAVAFEALDGALRAELEPRGELQNELVARVVLAAWRGRRAERMESELFARRRDAGRGAPGTSLGGALIRDAYGPRVVETLLRYRASVHADFFRALGALRVLQAREAGEEEGSPGRKENGRARAPARSGRRGKR